MAFSEAYQKQVALLMRVLPFIAEEDCFALKGGTAINFFVRNMPRLSVDIDLTYLAVAPIRVNRRSCSPIPNIAAINALWSRPGSMPRCSLLSSRLRATIIPSTSHACRASTKPAVRKLSSRPRRTIVRTPWVDRIDCHRGEPAERPAKT